MGWAQQAQKLKPTFFILFMNNFFYSNLHPQAYNLMHQSKLYLYWTFIYIYIYKRDEPIGGLMGVSKGPRDGLPKMKPMVLPF